MAVLTLLALNTLITEIVAETCYYSYYTGGGAGASYNTKFCVKCCGDYGSHTCCQDSGSSNAIIIGVVCGVTVLILLLVALALCYMKNFNKRKKRTAPSRHHRHHGHHNDHHHETTLTVHGAHGDDMYGSHRSLRSHGSRRPKSSISNSFLPPKYAPPPGPPPVYTYPAGRAPDRLGPNHLPTVV